MKNADEAIEKVLAGLRNCESTVGMEDRILRAVQDHAAKRTALGWSSLVPNWPLWSPFTTVISWGCAAVLVAFFGVLISIHLSTKPPAQLAKSLPANSEATIEPTIAARSPQPHVGETTAGSKRKTPALRTNLRHRRFPSGHSSQLASHPAPPLPLTRQEQLLSQIAHRIDPKQLAMLNPTQQALQNAKEKKEFQEFFGPTTMRGDE